MATVERIEDWSGQDVFDVEGERLGKLDDVYYAEDSREAVFVRVKSGLLGRRRTVLPLAGATVGRDYVRLSYSSAQLEAADADSEGGEIIDESAAAGLAEAFGVPPPGRVESASSAEERRRRAREAEERAAELEENAERRAGEAQSAKAVAADAAREAAGRDAEARRAREEAEAARAEAPPPA